MSIKATIIGATLALGLGAVSASAATYYSSYVTGDNLGVQNIAVLTATQNGSSVDFALTNTIDAPQPSTAFIAGISFTYGGTVNTSVSQLLGSQAGIEGLGSQGLSGGGMSFNIGVQIDNSNNPNATVDRLEVGETALFSLSNVQLSLFDFGALKSGLHAQGLSGGGSTKYTTGNCVGANCGGGGGLNVVPLPAGLPLVLTGLGVFGAMRLRQRKTV